MGSFRRAVPIAVLLVLAGSAAWASERCLTCHPSARGVLAGVMATRTGERAFARRAFGAAGAHFFTQSCGGCHVASCADCHGATAVARPRDDACLRCHRGYAIGWDYHGRAPREDHPRYQRGPEPQGERFLTMLPDVHRERGMGCADCHTMRSLQEGRRTGKTCTDCHPQVDLRVPEHSIASHLTNMTCAACHAAWAAQEYGTFLVRPANDEQAEAFAGLPTAGPWLRSAFLRRQDAPPLGLDARGRVAPIRPQFILFATDPAQGLENRLLAAEWRAFTPHTIRRGTVACGGCHGVPRRWLLEPDADRIHLLERDGLPLRSFWSRDGQVVANGSFLPPERAAAMDRRTPEYVRAWISRWKELLAHVDPPSGR